MTIKVIPKGTKCCASILGYYNFWYPDKNITFLLTKEVLATHIPWHSGGSEYISYKIPSDAIPDFIKTPIPIVWVKDGN
jgi:hypothetical protein